MAFFKVKVGETVYELPKLTMGGSRILKHNFGIVDQENMEATDPDVLVGFMALAIRHGDPSKSIEQATAEAEDIAFEDFVKLDDEAEVAAPLDPAPVEDASVAAADPATSGAPETIPETAGVQS